MKDWASQGTTGRTYLLRHVGAMRNDSDNLFFFPPRVNLGRPREPLRPRGDERILVHRSVKTRMDSGSGLEGRKYEPKAKFDCGDVEWVD